MQRPLAGEVGWLGTGPTTKYILDGRYLPPDERDMNTKWFIKSLQQNLLVKEDQPPYKITPTMWIEYWRTARENTASASNLLNFSVFIAGADNPSIAEFDATMTDIPMQTGYSPKRRRIVIDVMLIKKMGVILVDKLQTIIYFQPDYNYMNKYLGR
jgi:hypothetical protein